MGRLFFNNILLYILFGEHSEEDPSRGGEGGGGDQCIQGVWKIWPDLKVNNIFFLYQKVNPLKCMYRVFTKNCVFFTIHYNPSLAYIIAVKDLQGSLNAMRVYNHSY